MTLLGTWECSLCRKLVDIHDWLPECVLCQQCSEEIAAQEELAAEADPER